MQDKHVTGNSDSPVLEAGEFTRVLNPSFDSAIFKQDITREISKLIKVFEPVNHNEILTRLLGQIEKLDFREYAALKTDHEKLGKKHYLVCGIEQILNIALENNWGICKNHNFVYLYNGAYWNLIDNAELESFLGEAAEKMGVDKFDARLYTFREQLFKQFLAVANLPKPAQSNEVVLINLKNGTFEIGHDKQELRPPERKDFITYQLPFEYNPKAIAPLFEKYLNAVQPDMERQNILSEYLGYLFVKPSRLKLEKTLLLYGSGANGKSVFFEIVNALLGGDENVSSYSLQNLTNDNGYFRAMLGNKLVNYASEINGKLETSIFKQLVSGEPVDARLPYGEPFTMTNYAKLIFNCNELPKEVEQSHAYFRRFMIVPFDVTIPEAEQDKELAKKIIDNELSGVFNWVLDGLRRLLLQKGFTKSEAVNRQIENYKMQSDNVQLFLTDEGFEKNAVDFREFKELFNLYRTYCTDSGYHACSKKTFAERLRHLGFITERKNYGLVIFVNKTSY
jgi:putative DNA primase/helicase